MLTVALNAIVSVSYGGLWSAGQGRWSRALHDSDPPASCRRKGLRTAGIYEQGPHATRDTRRPLDGARVRRKEKLWVMTARIDPTGRRMFRHYGIATSANARLPGMIVLYS